MTNRDYTIETIERVTKIRGIVESAGAKGIVFGSSGGKDSALTGILCKMACNNTLGIIMPCGSSRNYGEDKEHALLLARKFNIDHITVDLTQTKETLIKSVTKPLNAELNKQADINIAPRLRMTTLYAIAANLGYLVAGTSNRSEIHMGYFTKWGDAACDFNPVSDLTKTEIFEFLRHLEAPEIFYTKPPSAGLYEGQTDESDMGITYDELDRFLLTGEKGPNYHIIEKYHNTTQHKRN
jgi:NAD+ synthase